MALQLGRVVADRKVLGSNPDRASVLRPVASLYHLVYIFYILMLLIYSY